ncbi:MAG: hypothetical protein GXP49_11605 [Deltaproteobacteria bacterium]|nr:hypothetical protein [Deltaproteobacteria bacterium]
MPPQVPGSVCLAIHGLPRLGPFRLELGKTVLELAYKATGQALDSTICGFDALHPVNDHNQIHPVACYTGRP